LIQRTTHLPNFTRVSRLFLAARKQPEYIELLALLRAWCKLVGSGGGAGAAHLTI
jgi:hypothetical protein